MSHRRFRIAILTGGGDAPGLNGVIRATVMAAEGFGWECYGIRDGFDGLLAPQRCEGEGIFRLRPDMTHGIVHLGGSILGSSNRSDPMHFPTRAADGSYSEQDRTDAVVALCAVHGVDALVMVGGDGSMAIADCLQKKGLRVVGVPKTIDNDLERTAVTFGFNSAVGFATECIDRLHSTAFSHHRVMVVEVMGRYAGWIALHAGLAGGAHAILIPEIPFNIDKVADAIAVRDGEGRHDSIIVVAEGARALGGQRELVAPAVAGHVERLGGIGAQVEARLQERTGKECRSVVLGHLLRGGSPSATDRVLALRFGAAAVRALAEGHSGVMVALGVDGIERVPLADVAGRSRQVPLNSDLIVCARELGLCLGD